MKALIIVSTLYNARELWGTMKILKNNDIDFEVISLNKNCIIQDEEGPETIKIHGSVDDFILRTIEDFDALFIISGALKETMDHWHHKKIRRIVNRFNEQEKVIAAICCSVPTIRYVCKGKKVAFFPLAESRALLKDAGAVDSKMSLMIDGRIITAETQIATKPWAQMAADVINGKEVELKQDFAFDVDDLILEARIRRRRKR